MADLQAQIDELKKQVEVLQKNQPKDKMSFVVFSGSLDKILAAFIIATGAAASGTEVNMFFTFWATAALRDPNKSPKKSGLMPKMFGKMLPKGFKNLKLSNMNMGGMGTAMMNSLMKQKDVVTFKELLESAELLEIQIYICEMSMDLMGMSHDEMIDYAHLGYAGVGTFIGNASESKTTLFI